MTIEPNGGPMLKKIFTFLFLFGNIFMDRVNAEIPGSSQCIDSNTYFTGYLQAKIEDNFPNSQVQLFVDQGDIIIYQYPEDPEICESIRSYLAGLEGFRSICFDRAYSYMDCNSCEGLAVVAESEGNWFPELTEFFPTMLANPRILGYSAGYRSYDRVFKTAVLPVSMGDKFTIYQFNNLKHGYLNLGLETGVWAVFEAKPKSLALLNADYFVGLHATYFYNRFTVRFRIYHESSHLGDELLVEKRYIHRLNPSTEAVDLFIAYDFSRDLTIFAGAGRTIRSDNSFKTKPFRFVSGFNYFINDFRRKVCNLEAVPYVGLFLSNSQDYHYKLETSVAVGYQWDKHYGRKLRLYLEGHNGFSHEGQFSKKRTSYLAIKLFYGY
jgi:hypothetical protein